MNPMKETLVALGAGVAIAAIVACGGSPKQSTMAPPMTGAPGAVLDPTKKSQIDAFDKTITEEFAKLEAGPRPDAPPSIAASLCPAPPCAKVETAVKPSDDPTCTHGERQTCKDTCQIADAICDAATKICGIAADMNNDTWANEKCSSGNASCEKSRGKCCGCS